jgi:hypothetical protein
MLLGKAEGFKPKQAPKKPTMEEEGTKQGKDVHLKKSIYS